MSSYLLAQTDSMKITSALKAIENNDFQIALQRLSDVSNIEKKNKMFLYYSGEAYYNLLKFDSAEVYYKNYMILDSTDKNVSDKLDDIYFKRKKGFKQVAMDLLTSQLDNQKNNDKEFPVEYHVSLNCISSDSGNVNRLVFINNIKQVELMHDRVIIYTLEKKVICTLNNDCRVEYQNTFFIDSFDAVSLKRIYIILNSLI